MKHLAATAVLGLAINGAIAGPPLKLQPGLWELT
jgi:hypothetical protein